MGNIPVVRVIRFDSSSTQINSPNSRNNPGKDSDLEQVLFWRSSTVAQYIAAAHQTDNSHPGQHDGLDTYA